MKTLFAFFLIIPICTLAQESRPIEKITLGSCSKQNEPNKQLWEEINLENSDLWIWLGDIIYGDSDIMDSLKNKYSLQKNHSGYQELLLKTPVIGIWDDHDYGVNDGDRTYPYKRQTKELLFDFLEVPESSPDRQHAGAYQAYEYGPEGQKVKIILLDGRSFRDPLGHANKDSGQRYYPDSTGQFLGEAQWKWLEKELKNSTAQVHVLASGIQILSAEHPYEKWNNFPNERKRLFELLSSTRPAGLVLVSGDRHIGEVSKMNLHDDFVLYEMTTSGLSHTWDRAYEESNPYRVDLVISRNYGLIEIDWTGQKPAITIKIKGPERKNLISKEVVQP